MVNSAPLPTTLSTSIMLPALLTEPITIDRPKPVPLPISLLVKKAVVINNHCIAVTCRTIGMIRRVVIERLMRPFRVAKLFMICVSITIAQ